MRQIASVPEAKADRPMESPKIETLIEQLSDAAANGHKMLVFVNFLNALERIGEQLDAQGIDYVSMSGSTRDRQRLVERFQNDTNCKVFLMTLKTGGTGLNLTAADMVFVFDPWSSDIGLQKDLPDNLQNYTRKCAIENIKREISSLSN